MLKPVVNSENTIKASWFEFLLNPNLLQTHLSQKDADPPAGELIIQFLVNANAIVQLKEPSILQACIEGFQDGSMKPNGGILEIKENEAEDSKKSLSLKILAFKTFSSMQWDLNFIEQKLPLTMQYSLLSSFLNLVLKDVDLADVTNPEEFDFSNIPHTVVFALSLYHRWCVTIIVKNSIPTRPQKTPAHVLQVLGQNDPTIVAPSIIEATIAKVEENLSRSITILEKIFSLKCDITIPILESFGSVTEETVSVVHNWEIGQEIKHAEFAAQTAFDLACLYFFQQKYDEALVKFTFVHQNINEIQPLDFCKVNLKTLNGYCQACEGIINKKYLSEDLIDQIYNAASNQSDKLIGLLQEDNQKQDMSIIQREQIESDLFKRSDRDSLLHFKVLTCNVVCQVIRVEPVFMDYIKYLEEQKNDGITFFFQIVKDTLKFCNSDQICFIKNYLRSLCMINTSILNRLNAEYVLKKLFSEEELDKISEFSSCNLDILEPVDDTLSVKAGSNTLYEFGELQNQLILTYELAKIENLLKKIQNIKGPQSPWKINRKWSIPQPLHGLLTSMHSSFIKDMAYIVLAKAAELKKMKKYSEARALFRAVETELRDQNYQLSEIIRWEVLLIDILLYYKNESNVDVRMLKQGVKMCISAVIQDKGSDVLPRSEIIEHCAAFLLNTQEWDHLNSLGITRCGFVEFAKLMAVVCQELKENKDNRMASQELWMIILPIFSASQSQFKRTHGGSAREQPREAPHAILTKLGLMQFLDKIQDPLALSVMISCFSKLFNLLKDDATYNLHLEHDTLWSFVLQNANSLSLPSVEENLDALLKHAFEIQSSNPNWLRTFADIGYAHGYYSHAIKYYLKAGIVISEYFSVPVSKQIWNDQVYSRMIRCCTHLHCYTQAAVLCQFTSEVDYAAAFKWLSERPCSDSCDTYYKFIWDITLLEYLVNLHAKRAETDRRLLALSAIGLLELNANNNEEILQNAAQVRKTKFLIAMAKQYL